MIIERTGLAIDPDTNDLYLDDDDNLALVLDAQAVGQHVRQRLLTFEGEWFLDTQAGVSWLSDIFASDYNPALAEAVTKAEILDTDGVVSIDTFSVSFSRPSRDLIINDVQVNSDYDVGVTI